MTEYILKPGQEPIQIVDGPSAGRKYKPGVVYLDIPSEEIGRFDIVKQPVVAKKNKAAEKEVSDEIV